MKRFVLFSFCVLFTGFAFAGAVPSQCEDVMLQGFYWNSYHVDTADYPTTIYGDTRWETLYKQSSEIGAYFDLVWLPPSAYAGGMGYQPKQYSNQNSEWGTRTELEALIAAFHNQGTKVVADMVINHISPDTSWCDLMREDFGEYGVFEPNTSWICNTDEMNDNNSGIKQAAGSCWGQASGAADDGYGPEANYAAARDWAHNQENVRQMFRAYAKWLINVMHYDGFRYDYSAGYNASHINDYNNAGNPYLSFMEMWSGNDAIIRNLQDASMNSMALDFQTKYSAFDGIAGFDYSKCRGSGLLGAGYSKYAVTFVENHDMFYRDNGQEFGGNGKSMTPEMKDRLLQANAFLLSMPGVPTVFYPHWSKYKAEIIQMINARHIAGVHSESRVQDEYANHDGYQCTVVGKSGILILQLGNKATTTFADPTYHLMANGNGYSIWVSSNVEHAPAVIVTPSTVFEDSINGIAVDATVKSFQNYGSKAYAYYTLDGSNPTLSSEQFSGTKHFNFKQTTTLKIMGTCGNATGKILTYTYEYREPQQDTTMVDVLWEENFNKDGDTYVEKAKSSSGAIWPFANQWFKGYDGAGDVKVLGSLYQQDYTNVTSYGVTIRSKKLNGIYDNDVVLYFPTGKAEDKNYIKFEGNIQKAKKGLFFVFDVASDNVDGGDLSAMVLKINDKAIEIPATTLGKQLYTSTVSVALPNENITSIYIAFNNAPSQRVISKMWIDTVPAVIKYSLSVQSADPTMGAVRGGGTYPKNSTIAISAVAFTGYHFVQWQDGISKNPRAIQLTQDTTFTAEFAPDQYYISVASSDNTKGSVSGYGTYNYGEVATLTATATTGYQFNGWNDGNTDNPRYVAVIGDATYTANFGVKICQLTIKPNDIIAGAVTGGGTFEYGTQVTINAKANSGYQFIKWSNGATFNPYVFTIVDDMNLTAFFQQTQAEIVDVDEVAVTPTDNSANIVWPQVDAAATYSLIIWTDATHTEKICTLTFDASGRLTNIDFAKKSNRSAYAQEEQIAGFSFTVTGLDEGTQYFFRIAAANSGGTEISHEDGQFKTTKSTATAIEEMSTINCQLSTKVVIDGHFYIFRDGKMFDVTGNEVR